MDSLMRIPTPGEILSLEFLEPMGITLEILALSVDVPLAHIEAIIKEGRAITADTAERLSRFFGTTAQLWINLQSQYDADVAKAGG